MPLEQFFADKRKKSPEYVEFLSNLKNTQMEMYEEVFGFSMNILPVEGNSNILDIELTFSDTQKVIISYEKREELFALASMIPRHPNFDEIQKYLYETQDTAGFLAQLNLFFQRGAKTTS